MNIAPRRRSLRLQGGEAESCSLDENSRPVKRPRKPTKPKSAVKVPVAKKGATLTRAIEQKFWDRGHGSVAGVDEAGRGPLAGPVVAAACIVPADVPIDGVTDSKALTEADRERIFEQITNDPRIQYAIGIVNAQEVDRINILQATFLAMETAVARLPAPAPSVVLIDGNQTPRGIHAQHVETLVKGDARCFSIAAASVLAKVTRDRMMYEAHEKWPQYGFAAHKGYGTKAHMAAVRALGPCPIHRLTFRPLPEICAKLRESGNVESNGP